MGTEVNRKPTYFGPTRENVCYTEGMEELTIAQAAVELGLTPRGLRKRIARRGAPVRRVTPRLFLITRADLEQLHAQQPLKRGPKPRGSRNDAQARAD